MSSRSGRSADFLWSKMAERSFERTILQGGVHHVVNRVTGFDLSGSAGAVENINMRSVVLDERLKRGMVDEHTSIVLKEGLKRERDVEIVIIAGRILASEEDSRLHELARQALESFRGNGNIADPLADRFLKNTGIIGLINRKN